jgi:hypothetical protein
MIKAKNDQAIMRQWKSMRESLDHKSSLYKFESPFEVLVRRAGMTGIALVCNKKVGSYVALTWD